MEQKFKLELELNCIEEEGNDYRADDKEFYETIEAPKFVDFTRPNHFCPDDRYWFCFRVGCNQKHEEELDSEAIYKNFVLRVMAARSPNVRYQRSLTRKPLSDSKKCPMSAPPKSSKSRIPRLALISSFSKKLMDNGENRAIKPAPLNPPSKSKRRVKNVPAKYMTSPKKKKRCSPKLNAFQSVRNPTKTSITLEKNKVVAKALKFNSPKKSVKVKTSELAVATPITQLCEGVRKLAINSEKKRLAEKPSVKKLLPSDASRKQPSAARKAKILMEEHSTASKILEHGAKSSKTAKTKKHEKKYPDGALHELRSADESRCMEIDDKSRAASMNLSPQIAKSKSKEKYDGNSRNNSQRTSEKEPNSSSERPLTTGSSDEISSVALTSDFISDPEGRGSDPQVAFQEENEFDQNKENNSSATEDIENQNPAVVEEPVDNDDKENALDTNNMGNVDGNILMKHNAPAKSKVKRIHKIQNEEKKPMKENCHTVITHVVKYKKLKPTNPKPFRLRTDERGILKEANLERKANSHENSTATSENSHFTENGVSETREKVVKKVEDRTLKKVQFIPVKSKYKKTSKEFPSVSDRSAAPCSENRPERAKTPASQKQSVRPLRDTGSRGKSRRLSVTKKTHTTTSKPNESRQQFKELPIPTNKATVNREPTFHNLHKPKSCSKRNME